MHMPVVAELTVDRPSCNGSKMGTSAITKINAKTMDTVLGETNDRKFTWMCP